MSSKIQPGHRAKGQRSVTTLGLVFCIANTDKGVLDWCLDVIGAGVVVEKKSSRDSKNPRRLRCYSYRLDAAKDLEVLLEQLLPKLKVKVAQTEAAMRFIKSRSQRPSRASFNRYELDCVFDVRLANQRGYESHPSEDRIKYKKKTYNRDEFADLLLSERIGYHVVEWTKDMEALIGTDTDSRVAESLGLKRDQVRRQRVRLGISPFAHIKEHTKSTAIALRAEGLTLEQISGKLGISFSSVQRICGQA